MNRIKRVSGVTILLLLAGLHVDVFAEEPPVKVALPESIQPNPSGDNPYRLAQVGDWVEWKITTQIPSEKPELPPIRSESRIKETVRSVNPKLLAMQIQIVGQTDPVFMETQYSLERPYHPEWMGMDGRVEQLKEPVTEKREVSGQSLECIKKELKMTTADGSATLTVWYQTEIPLGGVARMELLNANGTLTIREAMAFGREKGK